MFEQPHRLHPAAILINFGTYLVATIRALIAPLAAVFISGQNASTHYRELMIGGSIALVGGIALIRPLLHFFSTVFYIEGGALVISSGFVWKKRRTIPLARIQNVNVERTIWHRLLGAAAVKVETAAGHHTEGDLTALSLEDANKLQSVLLQSREPEGVVEQGKPPEPLYQLAPKQVLLAGALGNRMLYIVGSIIAVFQFEGSQKVFEPLMHYVDKLGPVATALTLMATFFGLVLVGWLVSIGISATRFFGFRIEQHERGLLLTHGLITQFRTVIPVGRIQDVRIVEPIFFRLLGYCELYADTAGSFDKKDLASANKVCPILPEREVGQVGKLLLPDFEFEALHWRQVSSKTVLRHAWRYFLSTSIVLAYPLWHWTHWYGPWALLPFAAYAWVMGMVSYRFVGYAFTSDLLVSRTGVFRKQAVMIPFDRIQHYTINSTFFQRMQGLATVTAISASTGGHPIHIPDVEAHVAESLRQTIGTAIRSHLGSRRGGL